MATDYRSLPQVTTGGTLRTRNIFATGGSAQYVPTLAVIDGTLSRDTGETPADLLRAGLLMGKVTTGGKYRPAVLGLLTGAVSAGSTTSLTVPASVAAEVARLIAVAGASVNLKLIGPPTAGGTVAVQAVTASAASGTAITISSVVLAAAVVGSIVTPADGSQIPVNVIPNQTGISVQDTLGNSIDQAFGQFLRGADLASAQIVNLVGDDFGNTTDVSVQAWIKTQLKGAGLFTFDNDR